ncbi:MAG: SDR family NAD(P)-dependent oxidoreductase, partial [Acidimicrobiales bacterium]
MGLIDERAGLAGRVAVVAGGGGGLGRAAVLDLAGAGASVAMCDIDAESLSATAADARERGADVLDRVADVRDPDALAAFFADVDERFGRLDVLVNVVGGTFRAAFSDVSAKGREALVRANFSWVADATALAARVMTAGGRGGSIITITSIEAHRAAPGYAVYAAMKAAVTHLARTLAVELGPAGIRVNCIAPDFVPTAGMATVAGSAGSAGALAAAGERDPGDALTIPLGRKGTAEDVGNCVLFLASDLSSYVTGTTLHPDGGALAASGWMRWPDDGFTARPPAWV